MVKKIQTKKLTVYDWCKILGAAVFIGVTGSLFESYYGTSGAVGYAFMLIACYMAYFERVRILNNLKN
ncbi:MAG: hypothetical protein WC254_06255 [Candidatus Woesearchaeota archaeon]|jgi:hypothetical protein